MLALDHNAGGVSAGGDDVGSGGWLVVDGGVREKWKVFNFYFMVVCCRDIVQMCQVFGDCEIKNA